MKKNILISIVCMFLLFPAAALADSITPDTYTDTLDIGETVTIIKTVTVDEGIPMSVPVDVFFLADSTGSMGGEIGAVQAAMSSILASTAGLGDVAFGVGEYRDTVPPDIYPSAFGYQLDQAITSDTAAVQSAIGAMVANEGGDGPEANLYALNEVANQSETGWRDGSARIIVWFGDAPGHDPSTDGVTEAETIASLQGANIAVQAIDVGYLDSYGQASNIAAATGGAYYAGIDITSIAATIQAAIIEEIEDYDTVALAVSGAPAGVDVDISPAYTGLGLERDETREFEFTVAFTGTAPGTYTFGIDALVDGGVVATEVDNITVPGESVPEPATLLLLSTGLLGVAGIRRRKK